MCHKMPDALSKHPKSSIHRVPQKHTRTYFSQFVVLFAPSYYQLLLFYLCVDHDKRYVFHKITHLYIITRTLVPHCRIARLVLYKCSWLSKDPDAKLRRIFLSQWQIACWWAVQSVVLAASELSTCLSLGSAALMLGDFTLTPTPFPFSSMRFSDLPLLLSEWGL